MPKDEKLKETIEKHEVLAAIQAVKDKGWDINPFTVAEEAHVQPFLISRDAGFMSLIAEARGGAPFAANGESDRDEEDELQSHLAATSDIPDLADLDRLLTEIPSDEEHHPVMNFSSSASYDLESSGVRQVVSDVGAPAQPQFAESVEQQAPVQQAPAEETAAPAFNPTATILDDELLNEQVKALLSSESDNQVKHLEQELEQAYARIAELEDDARDLNRSVIGLEKVNEALNVRMRELEDQARKQSEQDNKKITSEQLETINKQLAAKAEELSTENRALIERITRAETENEELKARASEHEAVIFDLEGKLSELQGEADNLALQLQNAFHVGYQKAVSDSQTQSGVQQQQQAEALMHSEHSTAAVAFDNGTAETVHAESAAEIAEPASDFSPGEERHEAQMQEAEQRYERFPEYTGIHGPINLEAQGQQQVHEHPGSQHGVLNFAQTGPQPEGGMNALESLT